jgi:tetratricopeptide (TPR) repeat protein
VFAAVGIVVAVFFVYVQTASHEFINYDDPNYILRNRLVQAGITWEGLRWAFTTFDFYYWQPLTWVSHMLDCQLFGLDAGKHHLVSVLLHAVNAVLLLFALIALTRAPGPSAVAAALFALHPLRVESVAWAAERKDVLSGLFWMLTLLAYAKYAREKTVWRYWLVFAAFLGAVMSKPTVVTLPFVLLLLDWWPLGRIGSVSGFWACVREKWPLFALIAASSLWTFVGQKSMGAAVSLQALPFWFRLWNAVVSYADYLGKFVWPAGLGVLYPYGKIAGAEMGAALLLLLAITGFVVWRGRVSKYLVTGWFWYVGALVPMIGLAQTGLQARADRFTYLPMIGLAILAAWGLEEVASRLRVPVAVRAGAVSLVLGVLTFASFVQAMHWKNSFTLFAHTIAVTRDNDVMHLNLGDLYRQRRDWGRAIEHFEAALRIEPNNVEAHAIAGELYLQAGKVEGAVPHLEATLRLKPGHLGARKMLGRAYQAQGRADLAAEQFRQVLAVDPGDAEARAGLLMMGR